MDRHYLGNMKKDKRTSNGLQMTTQKTKGRETRTLLTTGVHTGIPDG
jgi:hypothetical protein